MAKDIKQIIGENIKELRLNEKLTQFELAEKLNYSDKAVSKWERGESTPEPEVFIKLSKLFNVDIDYFYYDNSESKLRYVKKNNRSKTKNILLTILFCVAVLTISATVFTLACFKDINYAKSFWISFVYVIPVSSLITNLYFRRIRNNIGKLISISIFLWTTFITAYLQGLLLGINGWLIFIIAIPLQAIIIIYSFVKR